MKNTIIRFGLYATIAALFTFSACVKDPKPAPVVEQEEFNHALVQFIKLDSAGAETTDTISMNFDKSGSPTPSQATLANGKSYRMLITLSLDGVSINHEIIEEGVEHKFFLNPSVSGLLNYSYNDADTDGNGIGLDGKLQVIGAGTFDLKIVLRHALDKNAASAQAWNSTTYDEAGGEDDLNIHFAMKTE